MLFAQARRWNVPVVFSSWDVESRWSFPVDAFNIGCFKRRHGLTPSTRFGRTRLLSASSRGKERSFRIKSKAEVRSNFSFAQGRVFFLAYAAPTSCQGLLGIPTLLNFYFLSYLFFFFLISTVSSPPVTSLLPLISGPLWTWLVVPTWIK